MPEQSAYRYVCTCLSELAFGPSISYQADTRSERSNTRDMQRHEGAGIHYWMLKQMFFSAHNRTGWPVALALLVGVPTGMHLSWGPGAALRARQPKHTSLAEQSCCPACAGALARWSVQAGQCGHSVYAAQCGHSVYAAQCRHSGARKCSVCKALWCKEVLCM